MDLIVLNTNLDAVSIVDVYESFIWTDRYYEYGDFELFTSMTSTILSYIRQDYYLQNRESEHCMIIEKIRITSDSEDGNHITVTGRSLESILDRRIVWGQQTIRGNLQNGIRTLLNKNVISPSDSNRRISNFIFEASTDPAITKLTIDAQYTGDNLYSVINKICSERDIGFKITLNDKKPDHNSTKAHRMDRLTECEALASSYALQHHISPHPICEFLHPLRQILRRSQELPHRRPV